MGVVVVRVIVVLDSSRLQLVSHRGNVRGGSTGRGASVQVQPNRRQGKLVSTQGLGCV